MGIIDTLIEYNLKKKMERVSHLISLSHSLASLFSPLSLRFSSTIYLSFFCLFCLFRHRARILGLQSKHQRAGPCSLLGSLSEKLFSLVSFLVFFLRGRWENRWWNPRTMRSGSLDLLSQKSNNACVGVWLYCAFVLLNTVAFFLFPRATCRCGHMIAPL